MSISLIPTLRLLRTAAFAMGALLGASSLLAQAQFAGTYVGTINTRIVIPVINQTTESSIGPYLAVVSADGTINVSSGTLTGTVSATGAVTFTGGPGLVTFNIRSATIANNQFSSAYGEPVANSNGTTSFRFNASGTFTPPTGGGSTGGGSTGGGSTGGGSTGGGTTSGDLLAYYSFNDANNLLRDDSGRGFTLAPVNGTVSRTDGRIGAGALRTSNVRLRALVNSTFSTSAATISLFVRPTGPGGFNPRLAAVSPAGSSSQYYGVYLEGASTGNRRIASLQDANGSYPPAFSAAGAVPTSTSTWTHVAMTHSGNEVRIYINGNLSSTASGRRALGTFTSAMLCIAGSDNGLDLFNGDLDEIRIFNRALTAAEVSTLSTGGSVGTAATGVNTAAAVIASTVIASPVNLTGYRSRVGQSFELLVTGAASGGVWGTDVYTDDSSVARAAVHAGVVAVGETKTVTVTILPGQTTYPGSTRNGVTSSSWGSWNGSYSFAGSSGTAVAAGTASVAPTLPAGYRQAALNIIPGGRFVLPIPVTGTGPFTYQWFLNGVALNAAVGGTANPLVIGAVTAAQAGTYTVRVSSPAGTQTFTAGSLTVPANANAPQIVLQPFDKVVAPGGTFALTASALGSGLSYQWFRNNTAIPAAAGGTNSILLRQSADATDSGTYSVRVTNSSGTVTSTAATVRIDPNASRLSNLSGRIEIDGSDRVIPAFFVAGTGKKRVLIRAIGPGLAAFGVDGTMADPKFELYDGSNRIAENNDWSPAIAPSFAAVGAFTLPNGSRDAAGVFELDAGKPYSIHVFSNTNQGGVVLFEVYDLGNTSGGSKFSNVSVRGPTGTGAATLILGLNIAGAGDSKLTILARGVGPTLGQLGVSSTIADPKLEIFDNNQRSVLANDNWSGADFVTEMLQAREFVGAFALSGDSADASTLALLNPGSYTMQITAATGATSGEALVEIYEVP